MQRHGDGRDWHGLARSDHSSSLEQSQASARLPSLIAPRKLAYSSFPGWAPIRTQTSGTSARTLRVDSAVA